jgi:hypothetical protein
VTEQRRLAIIFRSGGVVLGGLFETASDYFAVIRRVTIVPAPLLRCYRGATAMITRPRKPAW